MDTWRPLVPADQAALTGLAGLCLAADGGQPFAADPRFLAGWYFAGGETTSCWSDERLVCAAALRRRPGSAALPAQSAVTTGLVDPGHRRRGLGGRAFGWAAGRDDSIRAETEMLSDGAHALYLSRGLTQVFAEDVMQLPASAPGPAFPGPGGLAFQTWGHAAPERFHAVYEAAFRDRPGFPGWTRERWVGWISDDEDFRPGWTLLATAGRADVGFVAGEATGWVAQLGVIPAARGQDIGAALMSEVIRRMRAAGETAITLNVNVNNPHAAALYRRLGFTRTGGRARYAPGPLA